MFLNRHPIPVSLAGLLLAFCLLLPPRAALAAAAEITLLFVARTTELTEADRRGGFARLAALAKAERAQGRPVLFIHGGDTLSHGVLSAFDQGAHQIDLLNALEIDAFAVQPREYNHGEDVLTRRAAEAAFPMVASNVRDSAGGGTVEGMEESLILSAGPFKIGLISIIGTDDLVRSAARRSRPLDPLPTARARAEALRARGADLVVAMTSDRRGLDVELRDSGIADIVFTAERPDMRAAVEVDAKTLFAAPASNARWAVALDIVADPAVRRPDGRLDWRATGRVIDSGLYPPDPAVGRLVQSYLDRLAAQQETPVLTLATAVDTRAEAVRTGENGFANLVADTVRVAMDADAALLNSGLIRGYRQYEPGHVMTRGEVLAELPFRNRVLLLELTGEQLRTALENALFDAENRGGRVPDGRFPAISNIRLSADLSRPPGGRLLEVRVGGRPLDAAAVYRVATTDFLASGGDGYGVLSTAPRLVGETEADQLSTIVLSAWSQMDSAAPATDGRIELKTRTGRR